MSIRPRSSLLFLLPALLAPALARADDDALAPYRERFRAGMDLFKAQNYAGAIQYWEPIYRELGPEQGYRLSFDLAQAYEQVGESTRAAERYEGFLAELAKRRTSGEKVDPRVDKEEEEAHAALEQLKASKGRIQVSPGGRGILAQIDTDEPRMGSFVAYKAPGNHVVTFAPGSSRAERHEVAVKAGEVIEVVPNPEPAPPPPPPRPNPAGVAAVPPQPGLSAAASTERPFSPVVLYVATGVTVASVALPIYGFAHANALLHDARSVQAVDRPSTIAHNAAVDDYQSARTFAYVTLAVPIVLAAVTAGLTSWYFAGSREAPAASAFLTPVRGGAALGARGSF